MDIECGGFTFISNFDSCNIDRVELVPKTENDESSEDKELPIYEFNIWTKPDCAGTEFANSNRSWFYFGVKGGIPCSDVKLNVVNLNKQGKLYSQGMAPVYKITPGPNRWERVRDRLSFDLKNNLLSFSYRTLENLCSTTYFAFTYPYSFVDLQNSFKQFDAHLKKLNINPNPLEANPDDIYFHRECLVKSLEDRSVDLITISSHHGITSTREPRLRSLFPDTNTPRSFQFKGKKVIFLSARVHPGETPSSFVMNGVLHLLLSKNDIIAIMLRKLFVFKLIPMLNPDGVSKGFYRTDTRGANLNRYYLNPSEVFHPSVFAARSLILYYHYGCEKNEELLDNHILSNRLDIKNTTAISSQNQKTGEISDENKCETEANKYSQNNLNCREYNIKENTSECKGIVVSDTEDLNEKVAEISVAGETGDKSLSEAEDNNLSNELLGDKCSMCGGVPPQLTKVPSNSTSEAGCIKKLHKIHQMSRCKSEELKRAYDSGLYLYIDFHGHASKRGIFMYGNHFDNISDKVECLLLPKLLSINNPHFHYNQCNFSKRNMYSRDRRDGLSKEGCGRVAVLKYTGLIKSYTLECNYNTGCIVNIIPPTQRPLGKHLMQPVLVPPKYTPQIYEEVGRALCVSILDMTGHNSNSRLPLSQYKTVSGLKESLRCEAILTKNVQTQQSLKMRQGIAMLQRGNKSVNKNFTSKRKLLLKKQLKSNLFTEITASQSMDKKESTASLRPSKSVRINSSGVILHSLNKSSLPSSTTGILKKQRKAKVANDVQKKLILKKKVFGAFKIEKELWQNRGESSDKNVNKRKIEKKLSPSGIASTSARPPNKKRKKSKIM